MAYLLRISLAYPEAGKTGFQSLMLGYSRKQPGDNLDGNMLRNQLPRKSGAA